VAEARVHAPPLSPPFWDGYISHPSSSSVDQEKASPCLKRGMKMDWTEDPAVPIDSSDWHVCRPHHRSALSTGECLLY